jgi:magnesium-transporting ATPase (P-type)
MTAVALALFLWEYRHAGPGRGDARALREAQTLAVTAVVLMQTVYVVQCRSLAGSARDVGLWRNPWIYAGIAVLLALQAAFVYLPVLQRAFGSAPIDGAAWLRAAAAALTVVPVVAAEQWWRRRRAAGATRPRVRARSAGEAAPTA